MNFCRLNFCRVESGPIRIGNQLASVFCVHHANAFVTSPEGARCFAAEREHRLTQHIFVAALSDFRTRVERER